MAFTAAVKYASTSWNNGTLVFNAVLSNIGNGYNPKTGVFTAPIDGTYVFYVAAVEYEKQHLRLDILINNVKKVQLIGHLSADYQTGTNMVVQYLKKGDNVWVAYKHGKGYYSESIPMTTFSGFMI